MNRLIIPIILYINVLSVNAQTVFKKSTNGILLKNNEPFFINGIYHVSWYSSRAQKISDIQLIAISGFNCIHASYSDISSTTDMLDEAKKLGVYMILEGTVYGNPKKLDASKVDALKNHPALLGWNLGDDVHDNTTTVEMTNFYNEIKVLDPNHPTFFTVYNKSKWNPYFGIGDYIMPYSYPLGAGDPMGWVDHQLTASRLQAISTGTSIIGIPQAYSWSGEESGAPSPIQYRNMVYQNLINDVKGALSYTFTESGNTNNYLPNWTSLWNAVKDMNQEIYNLQNILLMGKYRRANTGYKEGSSEGIQSAYWILDNITYVVVVNVNQIGNSINAIVMLPESSGTIQDVFQGKPKGMVFDNVSKKLTGLVNSGEVHVYKISNITENDLNSQTKKSIQFYPNPATDKLYLNNLPPQSTITIIDITGKVLIYVNSQSTSETIDISSLEAGIYLVKVGEVIKKISVQ